MRACVIDKKLCCWFGREKTLLWCDSSPLLRRFLLAQASTWGDQRTIVSNHSYDIPGRELTCHYNEVSRKRLSDKKIHCRSCRIIYTFSECYKLRVLVSFQVKILLFNPLVRRDVCPYRSEQRASKSPNERKRFSNTTSPLHRDNRTY